MEIVLLCMLAIITVTFMIALAQLKDQVKNMEKKVDAIAEHLGLENAITPELQAEIENLLDEDKRIKAIKTYRIATGDGLKESSDAIDQLIKKRTS